MEKIINICFITDKKYATPTGVAVQSLIDNKNKATLYNINIICTDLDQDQTKSFEKLNTYNVNVSVINTCNKYENIGIEHVYVSKAAMLKFDLPNILSNIDKVLYLDGDMLIFDDLSSLYDIDLKNKYAAVVKDMAGTVSEGHHIKMKHKDYFNSGMMLLNLKKMRKEDTTSKLLYAKKHDEYKHFMDQDALNQVFNENVIYVSPKYNYMKANLNYTPDQITKFYKIKKSELEQISQKPTILHLTNIKKPWSCKDAPCFNIWQKYYKKYLIKTKGRIMLLSDFFSRYKRKFDANSTIKGNFIFTKEKLPNDRRHIYICGIKVFSYSKHVKIIDSINHINKNEIDIKIRKFNKSGINNEPRKQKIIMSMTSFPARMKDIHYAVFSLLNQTVKPDEIVLWLGSDKFPNKEKDLPETLLQLCKYGLTIKWCKDIRSYTKLLPSLKEYPNDIIITVDDDIFYPEYLVEKLYDAYKKQPKMIHCLRAHKVVFDSKGNIKPYNEWSKEIQNVKPGFDNFFTGVGGVLYPPHCLYKDVTKESLFMDLTPRNDDIWFWVMAVKNNTKINVVDSGLRLNYINPERELCLTNEITLASSNVSNNGNDPQMKAVMKHFKLTKKDIKK